MSNTPTPLDLSNSLDLVHRATSGDEAAIDELLRRYQDRLRRIVRVRLGARLRTKLESMDIVQDALLIAARKLADGEVVSSGAVLNWLARIAENKIHDAHDFHTAQRRDVGREERMRLEVSGESIGWEPPGQGPGPSSTAEGVELNELVDEALAELSDDHREVMLLRTYCGVGWESVASAFDRTVPAVQELHRRARILLQERVRPLLRDGDGEE